MLTLAWFAPLGFCTNKVFPEKSTSSTCLMPVCELMASDDLVGFGYTFVSFMVTNPCPSCPGTYVNLPIGNKLRG